VTRFNTHAVAHRPAAVEAPAELESSGHPYPVVPEFFVPLDDSAAIFESLVGHCRGGTQGRARDCDHTEAKQDLFELSAACRG